MKSAQWWCLNTGSNLSKAHHNKWRDIEFSFWSLGFKIQPQTFINLSRAVTLSQSQEKLSDELPGATLSPVTLPLSEAIESLKITLASFVKPQRKFYPKLKDVRIHPKSFLLVYIPFEEKHNELVKPDLGMAIRKNQLAMARNL